MFWLCKWDQVNEMEIMAINAWAALIQLFFHFEVCPHCIPFLVIDAIKICFSLPNFPTLLKCELHLVWLVMLGSVISNKNFDEL